jgi:hypothetical protein
VTLKIACLVLGVTILVLMAYYGLWKYKLVKRREKPGDVMPQEDKERELVFGSPEEWRDFGKRNSLFLARYANLQKAADLAWFGIRSFSEPIDRFVCGYGKLCCEDFYEIGVNSGNGCGDAAQKLVRGLYERAVTLRYLHEHPEELDDFWDFHIVSRRRFINAVKATMGADVVPPELEADYEAEYEKVKDRFMVTDCKVCGTTRPNHTWNKLDFVSMAKQTQLGKLLVPGYYKSLNLAHATVGALLSKLKRNEADDGFSFESKPQRGAADKALMVSHNIILDVLAVQAEHFKLPGLAEQLAICQKDFLDIHGQE